MPDSEHDRGRRSAPDRTTDSTPLARAHRSRLAPLPPPPRKRSALKRSARERRAPGRGEGRDGGAAPAEAELPFPVEDADRVNEAFAAYRTDRDAARHEHEIVELWTYCFVHRYFERKLRRNGVGGSADCDALVSRALAKVRRHREALRTSDRYANWVSVLCKNTFLNYLRGRRPFCELTEAAQVATPSPSEAGGLPEFDHRVLRAAAEHAIEGLPPFLRQVARLRILQDRSYPFIAEAVGRPVPIVRAYVNKARRRIRQHPTLRQLGRDRGRFPAPRGPAAHRPS